MFCHFLYKGMRFLSVAFLFTISVDLSCKFCCLVFIEWWALWWALILTCVTGILNNFINLIKWSGIAVMFWDPFRFWNFFKVNYFLGPLWAGSFWIPHYSIPPTRKPCISSSFKWVVFVLFITAAQFSYLEAWTEGMKRIRIGLEADADLDPDPSSSFTCWKTCKNFDFIHSCSSSNCLFFLFSVIDSSYSS